MANILLLFTYSFSIVAASISTANGHEKQSYNGGGYPRWFFSTDIKLLQMNSPKANLTVAQDGSGNYKTITEAIEASVRMQKRGSERFFIHMKGGIYKEVVNGVGFIARDMTFENTEKHQAIALRSNSDTSFFYLCNFKGYQDTLYVCHKRQFYRTCDIYGTIDFIFGNAAVVFDNCTIFLRKPMSHQKNTMTAQATVSASEKTGILIQNSRITASPELTPVQDSIKSYLGRTWGQYSRTVVVRPRIDSVIDPASWLPWKGNLGTSTLHNVECMNIGPGVGMGDRVKWDGYHVITSPNETFLAWSKCA